MTALRPYTLLSFSFSVSQTHTCTDTHSPCLPISRSLCLVSLPRLPLPPSHAHTDNGILYIVSLTQRRKHTHIHERSWQIHSRSHIHMHTYVHACSHTGLHDKYFTNTHRRYTFFLLHCLSSSQTHTLFFSHTHTHKRCTTLSVLEFYILMKEEARRPIKAVGAGRDHLSADSRVVRRQFDGALSGPWLPALPSGVPSSAGDWWYDPPGWIRTPPLCLPLFCQC